MPSYKIDTSNLLNKDNFTFKIIEPSDLQEALQVLRKSFYPHETVHKIVKASENEKAIKEIEKLCISVYEDGVSTIAVNNKTKKIVAVALGKIQKKTNPGEKCAFELIADTFNEIESKAVMKFMIEIDAKVNFFSKYNTDEYFELMFLGTLPEYCGLHLGTDLSKVAIQVAKQTKSGIVNILCTSPWTYKISVNLGFETLYKGSWDEFHLNGVPYSSFVEKTAFFTLAALKL